MRKGWLLVALVAALGSACEGTPARQSAGSPPAPAQTVAPHVVTPQPTSAPSNKSAPRGGEAGTESAPSSSSASGSAGTQFKKLAPGRLVAIGDVHGDLAATLDVLQLSGAIGKDSRWSGGNLVVVQTGDQLDRGDDEPEIVALFQRLAEEAKAAGGAVHSLVGNHEVMNAVGDYRYVTAGGFEDFASQTGSNIDPLKLQQVPPTERGRYFAFLPGGPMALAFAQRPAILQVNSTLFAHGGVRLNHVAYGIDRLNTEITEWLVKPGGRAPQVLAEEEAPIWSRRFAGEQVDAAGCSELREVLQRVGAARLVVGHTIQPKGISSACDGLVWRIDVGMSSYYGGNRVQALEIRGDSVNVITAPKTRTH